MRIEPYLHNTEQYFIFLMLDNPSGTPVSREKEVGVQVTSLLDCHNQHGSYLAMHAFSSQTSDNGASWFEDRSAKGMNIFDLPWRNVLLF